MNKKIRIGADELILWLRKNQIANDVPNDGITGLGRRIRNLITNEEFRGELVEENYSSRWAHQTGDENIGEFNLPKTSAQYRISIDNLGGLYAQLSTGEFGLET
jgi:hypothetical protein